MGFYRWLKEQGRCTHASGHGFERYDNQRALVTPPYDRFDYDVFKPLPG